MEPLIIIEESSTPKVVFDKAKGLFEISGNSFPENVVDFYIPVFNWIKNYKTEPNSKTELHVWPNYFNSSSLKALIDIFTMFEELVDNGHHVHIVWHYLDIDEDMLATGKEFEEKLNVPFTFVSYVEE